MEQFQINTGNTQESPEHFNQMLEAGKAAVANGNSQFDEHGNLVSGTQSSAPSTQAPATQQEPSTNQEPNNDNGVPEKFKNKDGTTNVEALLKSYLESEKKLGTNQEQANTNNNDSNTEAQTNPKDDKGGLKIESFADAERIAKEKDIDYNALSLEYSKSGNLSEDTYKMLNDKGIPKEIVTQFLEGQKAQVAAARVDILSSVGGEAEYIKMTEWAGKGEGLTPSELADYNRAMDSNDIGIIKLVVNGLKAKYEQVHGKTPNLISGKPPSVNTSNSQKFSSQQEMVNAMKDPKYATDSKFRAEVIAKIQKGFGN